MHSDMNLLHSNSIGFIMKCDGCKEVQFCFGNVLSFVPEDDFRILYNSFKKIEKNKQKFAVNTPNGYRLMLKTPVENIVLSFSLEEYDEVMELMDNAMLIIEAEQILFS